MCVEGLLREYYHHIRNLMHDISLGYVPITEQVADILTKALHSPQHIAV